MDKHAEDLLKNNEFYFCEPKQFGDENDCKIHVYYEGTLGQIKKHFGTVGYAGIRRHIRKTKNGKYSYYPTSRQTPYVRVFCLSKSYNDGRIWDLHANRHKGFCIEFETQKLNESRELLLSESEILPGLNSFPLYKVNYFPNSSEKINILSDFDVNCTAGRLATESLLFKEIEHTFEQEYRVILPMENFDIINPVKKFAKESLKSIIFGRDMIIEDIENIYGIIKEYYLPRCSINFYYMTNGWEKNSLERKKIGDIGTFIYSKKLKSDVYE